PGRAPHLAFGHQAVQDAILLSLPLGTLALWRGVADGDKGANSELFERVAKLAELHLRQVRLLVPRFHIAHWTALHHVRGILASQSLAGAAGGGATAKRLTEDIRKNIDVAQVYDSAAAAELQEALSQGPEQADALAEGSRMFQMMAQDPAKLAAFYSIDPEMPMEQKMERMARLLDPTAYAGTSAEKAVSRPRQPKQQQKPQQKQSVAEPQLRLKTSVPVQTNGHPLISVVSETSSADRDQRASARPTTAADKGLKDKDAAAAAAIAWAASACEAAGAEAEKLLLLNELD
ncbi:unnamed protein product, partial [Polarella glacialis]